MAKGAKAGSGGVADAGGDVAGASSSSSSSAAATSAYASLSFAEVLEDLSSRFIVNLPAEELASIERICFQVEQAHWFYEDFLRPLNPSLPSFSLRRFSSFLLHTSAMTVPLIQRYISASSTKQNQQDLEAAFDEFLKYKTRVPVCGVVMLNGTWDKCLLVKGWKSSSAWGFPKGKINQKESERDCAVREVYEETGFDCGPLLAADSEDFMELTMREQKIKLYIVPGVDEATHFETLTRKEISKIAWFKLSDLPTWKKNKAPPAGMGGKFYLISPFISKLKQWINENKASHALKPAIAPNDIDSLPVRPVDPPTGPAAMRESASRGGAIPTEPAAMRSLHVTPANKLSSGLLFPDSSDMFFPTTAAKPAASRQEEPQDHERAEASTEGLRALLGLGGGNGLAASGSDTLLQGRGAQMIEAQGDARSRQLLDLLRGSSSSVANADASPRPLPRAQEPPMPEHQNRQLDDRESGTAALLAALNAGAGKASQLGRPEQGQSSMLLSLLNGMPAAGSAANSAATASGNQPSVATHLSQQLSAGHAHANPYRSIDSPLPAPRAQNTVQHKSLLDLISPAGGSISISAGQQNAPPAVDNRHDIPAHGSSQVASQPPQVDDKEKERARKRDALLANLVGGQMHLSEPVKDAPSHGVPLPLPPPPPPPPAQVNGLRDQRSQENVGRREQEGRHMDNFRFPSSPPQQPPHFQQHQQAFPPPHALASGQQVPSTLPHEQQQARQQPQQQEQQQGKQPSMLASDAQTSGLLAMLNFGAAPSSQMPVQRSNDAASQHPNGLLAVLNSPGNHVEHRSPHQQTAPDNRPFPPHLAAGPGSGSLGFQQVYSRPPPPHWNGMPPPPPPPPMSMLSPHHFPQHTPHQHQPMPPPSMPYHQQPMHGHHPQMLDFSQPYSPHDGPHGLVAPPPPWFSPMTSTQQGAPM